MAQDNEAHAGILTEKNSMSFNTFTAPLSFTWMTPNLLWNCRENHIPNLKKIIQAIPKIQRKKHCIFFVYSHTLKNCTNDKLIINVDEIWHTCGTSKGNHYQWRNQTWVSLGIAQVSSYAALPSALRANLTFKVITASTIIALPVQFNFDYALIPAVAFRGYPEDFPLIVVMESNI